MLPVASHTVVIGTSQYHSLLDGVQIINLVSSKKENVNTLKIKENRKCFQLGLHCLTCHIAFETEEEHRNHYKSEWHRFNLKQKIRKKDTITELKFSSLENNDIDSSSSSESDDEIDDYNTYFSIDSKLFFENKFGNAIALYKCLVTTTKELPKEEKIISLVKTIKDKPMWFIVMIGGGRFSAAIFKGEEAIVHKTFHSYTVRAKQGGAQSTQDRSKGGSKSAGASLRRHNEASQLKHIQEIVVSWMEFIKECDRIFYRAIGPNNRNILFGGSNPLINKHDHRICQIPFGTKKATYGEVQKVRNQLSTILVYDSKEILDNFIKNYIEKLYKKKKIKEPQPKTYIEKLYKKKKIKEPKPKTYSQKNSLCLITTEKQTPVLDNDDNKEVVDEVEFLLSEDEQSSKSNNNTEPKKRNKKRKKKKSSKHQPTCENNAEVEELKQKLLSTIIEKDVNTLKMCLSDVITKEHLEICINCLIDDLSNTVLHLASSNGLHDHIYLLLQHGANPAIKNKNLKTPYEVAPDKPSRKVFRKFMADFPLKYDYVKARLPGALTEELEEELKERKKAKQKRAKERKVIEELKKEEEKEKEKFLQLSDREKCAIAAEKRFLILQGKCIPSRCFSCGINIDKKMVFEYLDYKFCSTQCVRNHRQKNSTK